MPFRGRCPRHRGGVSFRFRWSTYRARRRPGEATITGYLDSGTTPDYMVDPEPADFSAVDDVNSAAKVALLGRTVAKPVGDADPVGQTIRIKNVPFLWGRVQCVRRLPGRTRTISSLVPISTAKRKLPASARRGPWLDHGAGRRPPSTRRRVSWRRCCASGTASNRTRTMTSPSQPVESSPPRRISAQAMSILAGGDRVVGFLFSLSFWRYRHHEHHAGVGHGAHPRDRPALWR